MSPRLLFVFALLLAVPLNAQNPKPLEDSGWYWYEKAAVEGFLASAAVGGLVGVIHCRGEKPSYIEMVAMCIAPPVPVPNCQNDEGERENIKTTAKLAGIGSLIGIPVALLIRAAWRDSGEDAGAKLRVGPDSYRPERVSVEIRLPFQP